MKSAAHKTDAKPIKGNYYIGFGSKIGKPSIQGNDLSQFTSDFLGYVHNKTTHLPGDIMMASFLSYGAMESNC